MNDEFLSKIALSWDIPVVSYKSIALEAFDALDDAAPRNSDAICVCVLFLTHEIAYRAT